MSASIIALAFSLLHLQVTIAPDSLEPGRPDSCAQTIEFQRVFGQKESEVSAIESSGELDASLGARQAQAEEARPLPVFPAMESRYEAGGYFPPGNVIWCRLNKSDVRPGEWQETVGEFVNAEQAKLEYGNEILKVLLRNTNRAHPLRNPPITHIGYFDEEAAKAQEQMTRAKAKIEFERGLFPWRNYSFVWMLLQEYPSGIWGAGGQYISIDVD